MAIEEQIIAFAAFIEMMHKIIHGDLNIICYGIDGIVAVRHDIEFSEADGLFFGKVLGIRALISYEGTNAAELVADFHGAVDDYLSLCEAENSEPEKAYKGSFNIRVSPELHKQAAICAMAQQVSLNTLVEDALREYVAERKEAV